MKGVQCYELFGGIALKNNTFSFFSFSIDLGNRAAFIMIVERETNDLDHVVLLTTEGGRIHLPLMAI